MVEFFSHKEINMFEDITTSEVLGTAFFTIVVFVVGAVVGPKFFGFLNGLMPWNKMPSE
mgnify:FL=1|tara:strand:- start:233 stop:409 length:177 start_codon:yes stop_codon:yes gene_type:complete